MNEQYYEKLLNIKTAGEQKKFNESIHYHRYEPTSYAALEALSEHYKFTAEDAVVDFGCGKGRFAFYVNHLFGASVTGIEMNPLFYSQAVENKKTYDPANKGNTRRVNFLNCLAEQYAVSPLDNKFYFFNPFSMQIFAKVIKNILSSVETCEKEAEVILYYPSRDYFYFMDSNYLFCLVKEIRIPGLYENDPQQKFLIYRNKR